MNGCATPLARVQPTAAFVQVHIRGVDTTLVIRSGVPIVLIFIVCEVALGATGFQKG